MTNTSKKNKSDNGYLALVGAAIANVLLLSTAGTLPLSSAQVQGQGLEQQQQQDQLQLLLGNFTSQNDTRTVAAGGGGPLAVVTWFVPQNISISAGETVTWVNPSLVAEPHTVSFMKDPSYFANYESPYLIANGTEITPANPQEKNTEPFIIPSQNDTTTANTIIVANKRQASPVAIDAQNNAEYLPLNANYTMAGDESYVNSGIIFPESAIPPGAPPITSFSVTFENAGTYDYLCEFHPWMTGRVIVE
jgi:plastocyanin